MTHLALLQALPLFAGVPPDDLAGLAALLVEQSLVADEVVFEKGAAGDSLYVVSSGRIQVYLTDERGRRVPLKQHGAGEFFGEYSLLDDAPRSASASALAPTCLLQLHRAPLFEFIASHPLVGLALLRELAGRVRYSTDYLRRMSATLARWQEQPNAATLEAPADVGELTLNMQEFQGLLNQLRHS